MWKIVTVWLAICGLALCQEDCVPTDEEVAVLQVENNTYQLTQGVKPWPAPAGLRATFASKLKVSPVTGYDWAQVSQDVFTQYGPHPSGAVFKTDTRYPGQRENITQIVGHCGGFTVYARTTINVVVSNVV